MKNSSWIFIFVALACTTAKVEPPEPVLPVPTQVQLDWQEKELYAFIHFTVNNFTDKEWGVITSYSIHYTKLYDFPNS